MGYLLYVVKLDIPLSFLWWIPDERDIYMLVRYVQQFLG